MWARREAESCSCLNSTNFPRTVLFRSQVDKAMKQGKANSFGIHPSPFTTGPEDSIPASSFQILPQTLCFILAHLFLFTYTSFFVCSHSFNKYLLSFRYVQNMLWTSVHPTVLCTSCSFDVLATTSQISFQHGKLDSCYRIQIKILLTGKACLTPPFLQSTFSLLFLCTLMTRRTNFFLCTKYLGL